jgi:hypothetical protein
VKNRSPPLYCRSIAGKEYFQVPVCPSPTNSLPAETSATIRDRWVPTARWCAPPRALSLPTNRRFLVMNVFGMTTSHKELRQTTFRSLGGNRRRWSQRTRLHHIFKVPRFRHSILGNISARRSIANATFVDIKLGRVCDEGTIRT